jgi:hypothetical protein
MIPTFVGACGTRPGDRSEVVGDNYNWKIDEDEEQAGKQLILSREDVYGFNAQREGHGSLWFLVFAALFPFVVVIILALLIGRLVQVANLETV